MFIFLFFFTILLLSIIVFFVYYFIFIHDSYITIQDNNYNNILKEIQKDSVYKKIKDLGLSQISIKGVIDLERLREQITTLENKLTDLKNNDEHKELVKKTNNIKKETAVLHTENIELNDELTKLKIKLAELLETPDQSKKRIFIMNNGSNEYNLLYTLYKDVKDSNNLLDLCCYS